MATAALFVTFRAGAYVNQKPGHFYVGTGLDDSEPFFVESDHLTTHGVIVGMTGSGKTGLGVGLIEEALLAGVPCLILDPKGDMGNLLLNFPGFEPESFLPWIDAGEAKREGVTAEAHAEAVATKWKEGLEKAGIAPERMKKLQDDSEITIYTPGSTAGVPINVLGSLAAPAVDWAANAEVIRDEVESFVSSLLVMADIDADPISSPSHILLATIIEKFWAEGKDLDLETLIGQIPKPPLRKLGVFDIDEFFPVKDRMALAMKLNGLLASPSFASWLEGVPLDIEELIGGSGKTKGAIVYLAHLTDVERQFVVTLLLSKFITWMRGQSGSSSLRSLIYMDEVFGFAPPTAEPPSKKPILTILKQARAFGCGMVLSTQNPIDLDYKAISNSGTWLVGRLQTENDKKRILEGLDSAGATVDVGEYDRLISGLAKRQFLMHTTTGEPGVFATRWVMSYLAGPLTRDQITTLMGGRSPLPTPPSDESAEISEPEPAASDTTVPVMPPVAEGTRTSFLDPAANWAPAVGVDPTSSLHRAAVAATVQLIYDETKADINHSETYELVIYPITDVVGTENLIEVDHDPRDFLDAAVAGGAEYELPEAKIQNKVFWSSLETQLKGHLAANKELTVFSNQELGIYSRVDETEDSFRERCRASAEDAKDAALVKLEDKYKSRIDRAKETISKSENRVRDFEADASSKGHEELLTGAGDLLGALFGGKSRSDPIGQAARRRSATSKAKARAEAAEEKLADDMADLVDLEDELATEITALADEYDGKVDSIATLEIPLEKTDITVGEMKLVWVPS